MAPLSRPPGPTDQGAVRADGRPSAFGCSVALAGGSAIALAALLAPPSPRAPGLVLGLPLLVAATTHVAATPWLVTLRAARVATKGRRGRFLVAPALVFAGGVAASVLVSARAMSWVLLAFFAWQLWHFAKQNVGVACLAASAAGVRGLTGRERRWILCSGAAGIAGLASRPSLVEVHLAAAPALRTVATIGFLVGAAGGLLELGRRPRRDRAAGFVASYLVAIGFSCPIFFASSPYGAVAGMTIAHGVQYLGIVGLVAAGPAAAARRRCRVAFLVATAVLGGLTLHLVSRGHGPLLAGRLAVGAYLGAYAAHFVVDAGLWRLSTPGSRRFVADALPSLVAAPPRGRDRAATVEHADRDGPPLLAGASARGVA